MGGEVAQSAGESVRTLHRLLFSGRLLDGPISACRLHQLFYRTQSCDGCLQVLQMYHRLCILLAQMGTQMTAYNTCEYKTEGVCQPTSYVCAHDQAGTPHNTYQGAAWHHGLQIYCLKNDTNCVTSHAVHNVTLRRPAKCMKRCLPCAQSYQILSLEQWNPCMAYLCRGPDARVHWWYWPDSYDSWIPADQAPDVDDPDRPARGGTHSSYVLFIYIYSTAGLSIATMPLPGTSHVRHIVSVSNQLSSALAFLHRP